VVSGGDCLSRSDVSDETDDGNRKDRSCGERGNSRGNSVPSAKLGAERLSATMRAAFGRCDELLCRAVRVVGSHRTPLDYVSPLFVESEVVRRCAFDLGRPCQLDATSTGVQFLTLDAVRVSSASPF